MSTEARGTGRRTLRAAVQVIGFGAGVALLWWVVKGVTAEANRPQLEKLGAAPTWQIAAMLGLGALTIVINGAAFQVILWPVKRLRTLDVQAVNAVAALLALLPFKLSVIFRVLIHNRRDGVPLLTIAAWFAALAATMAVVVNPALGASLWRGTIDGGWWLAAGGGALVLTVTMIVTARALSDGRGWAWMERVLGTLRLTRLSPRVHEGLRMLSHGRAVWAAVALRVVDAAVHSARFVLAATILGIALPVDKAVIAGTAFFLIGAAAPTGQVGAREAGTAGLLGILLTGVDLEQFKLVVLLVSVTEASVLVVMAAAGGAWLRLGRRGRG